MKKKELIAQDTYDIIYQCATKVFKCISNGAKYYSYKGQFLIVQSNQSGNFPHGTG
jgi:hypothetical protein